MKRIFRLLILAHALTATTAAYAAGPYVLTDLGTTAAGDHASLALGINSYGQVVGILDAGIGSAFLWTPSTPNGTTGSLVDLGNRNEASAINDYGQVVGCSLMCRPGSATSPSRLWTPTIPNGTSGTWTNLPAPTVSGVMEAAKGINNSGQIVGTGLGGATTQIFLWSPTAPNGTTGSAVGLGDIAGLPDSSHGFGINSRGQIVGTGNAFGTGGPSRAVLWSPATPNGTSGSMIALLNTSSLGGAINDMGQVSGRNSATGTFFLWQPTTPNATTGAVIDLGKLPGASTMDTNGMNSSGSIVGTALGSPNRAFLWEPNTPNGVTGTLIDLNELVSPAVDARWHLQNARGINDEGQIVGYGLFDADGPGGAAAVTRAFLLTPVPEPAMIVLLAWALPIALVCIRRRRRS
jgi:hypothetical protein